MTTTTNRFLALEETIKARRKGKGKPKPSYRPNGNGMRNGNGTGQAVYAKSAPGIQYGPNVNQAAISDYTKGVIRDIMSSAGITSVKITSTARTPEEQARAMYTNLENRGVQDQLDLYAAAGDEVIRAYQASKKRGNAKEQIIQDMVAEILRQGPGRVSRHAADFSVLNVIDIAPSSVSNRAAFERAVRAEGRVSKFLTPADNDPAYHLEIPQPQSDMQSLMQGLSVPEIDNMPATAFTGPPPANPGIADKAKDLASDDLIMASYKGFHNFGDPWSFFFTKNSGLQAAMAKPNWDADLVGKYNDAHWKPKKVLQMIARDVLGKRLRGSVRAGNASDEAVLKEAYDKWGDEYYAVFWGKGHVCNLFVGEAIYDQGFDFLNSINHYFDPKGMDKGAGGRLVELQPDQVQKGDFFTLGGGHTGVIVGVSGKKLETREGTVDDDDMGKIRTSKRTDDPGMRFWRYDQNFSTGQSYMAHANQAYGHMMSPKRYDIPQAAYLMAKGVGVNGTYRIYGYINVGEAYADGVTKKVISVSGMGKTAASRAGKVKFFGNVDLIVNGSVTATEGFVYPKEPFVISSDTIMIGDAQFDYPEGVDPSDIKVKVTGGYVFASGHGHAAPLPPTTSDTFTLP